MMYYWKRRSTEVIGGLVLVSSASLLIQLKIVHTPKSAIPPPLQTSSLSRKHYFTDKASGWFDWMPAFLRYSLHIGRSLPYCNKSVRYKSPRIVTPVVDIPWKVLEDKIAVQPGGVWTPRDCRTNSSVAILVPYRDREIHLRIFLRHIHPYLQRQKVHYGVYVIEQTAHRKFNRATLLNIGFQEARKDHHWTCFVLHDIDHLPADLRNYYGCQARPVHMASAVDRFGYRMPYKEFFGGVTKLNTKHFLKVNGFSNSFFGWGGEDDDFFNRVNSSHLRPIRVPMSIGVYKTIKKHHTRRDQNISHVYKVLSGWKKRRWTDGLNNLNQIVAHVRKNKRQLFTYILVELK